MVIKAPIGYEFWAASGSKEEAKKASEARSKHTGKKCKIKKLGYRNYGIFQRR
jgi:hypothetical protein